MVFIALVGVAGDCDINATRSVKAQLVSYRAVVRRLEESNL